MSKNRDTFFIDDETHPDYAPPHLTATYIQLRFTLARFRVYRIVQLPVTFTFANLHTLIQYMFGWSDSHLHHAEVFSNVMLYEDEELEGTIKSCGRKQPLEDYELSDPWVVADWERFEPANKPIYRVRSQVTRRKDEYDGAMTMEEKGLTLESIWSHNERPNVSDGQCSNAQVGIIYTYNLNDEWNVHITCEDGDAAFFRLNTHSNVPIFKSAQGAPPVEHVVSEFFPEEPAEDKTVSVRLFDSSYFEDYRQGKVVSVTRKESLDILTLEEEDERRREYLEEKRIIAEGMARGEYDEEDMCSPDDDEYDE